MNDLLDTIGYYIMLFAILFIPFMLLLSIFANPIIEILSMLVAILYYFPKSIYSQIKSCWKLRKHNI